MARTKATLGSGARLTDFLSTSLLSRVYPSLLIGQLLDTHGCNSQRQRSLPATAGVYYCMALSLYPEAAYGDVFDAVAQGLAWQSRNQVTPTRIKASSISTARTRLSWPIFKDLQERACQPLALAPSCPSAFYRGLRLMAMDGSNFEVPDEAANIAAFGYPGSRTGVAGYPQAQCAILVECATHAIVGANIGAYREAEWKIAKPLLARLDASMLCLADRGFNGYEHWCAARATGAQLLWRCAANRQLPVIQALSDGSFISQIKPGKDLARRDSSAAAVKVRVIEYTLPATNGEQTRYRLLTSLLDQSQAPALELAAVYHERWEVESVFDELKTHLHQRRRVLRSKTPDLVRQEFYGWVLAHYAVRWLMHSAGSRHDVEPKRLSFVASVQHLKREQVQSGVFPPSATQTAQALV
jgi:Transposase DDE domain/Insertion element 4 transposase N-terminal